MSTPGLNTDANSWEGSGEEKRVHSLPCNRYALHSCLTRHQQLLSCCSWGNTGLGSRSLCPRHFHPPFSAKDTVSHLLSMHSH